MYQRLQHKRIHCYQNMCYGSSHRLSEIVSGGNSKWVWAWGLRAMEESKYINIWGAV